MPNFTLHRTFILRTNKGHSIKFVKDQPTWVPPICIEDVIAIGAVPEENVDIIPEEELPPSDLPPDVRESKLYEAFDTLIARNERGDFTASNQPHCKKLQAIVGFAVTNNERDEVWRKYRQERGMPLDEEA